MHCWITVLRAVIATHPEQLANATTSSHGVDVAEALTLIDVLHGETVEVVVLGISTGNAPAGSEVAVETLLERAWPALEVVLDEVVGDFMSTQAAVINGHRHTCLLMHTA